MKLFSVKAIEKGKTKECWFKPTDLEFISIEKGKTMIHLYFQHIGARVIVVEETPDEINAKYAESLKC